MEQSPRKRFFLLLAVLAGISATVALLLFALSSNIDLFYTPGEVLHGTAGKPKPAIGQRLRLGGMVKAGSVQRNTESLNVIFDVYDLNGLVTVEYNGILPDLFREEQSVVVQGEMVSADTLLASEVLAKHDENYMPPEIQAAMDENHIRPVESYNTSQSGIEEAP